MTSPYRKLILTLLTLTTTFYCCSGTFYTSSQPVFNGNKYGQICVDRAYIPTCGWKLAISIIDFEFNSVDTWECINQKVDSQFYFCENEYYTIDLTQPPPCWNINIGGTFGNTEPEIQIGWYCICDDTTNGQCELVDQFVTTTAAPPTTTTTTTTTFPPWLVDEDFMPVSDASQVLVTSEDGDEWCYVGSDVISRYDVDKIDKCVLSCIFPLYCRGVNYWPLIGRCDIVTGDVTSWAPAFSMTQGCRFYRVVFKR